MKYTDNDLEKKLYDLRRKAERRLAVSADHPGAGGDESTHRLLHDLQVQQIELEMQNEELREAHRLVEQSRDRYLELYQHAPVGYVVTDSAGMILQANQTFSHMLNAELGGLLEKPLVQLIHEEDREIFLARFKAFFNNPAGKRIDIRMLTTDQTVLYTSLEGRRTVTEDPSQQKRDRSERLLLTVGDITRRKLTEQAIIRAKTQWEQTFDAVPDLIAILNEKSEIVRVNQALASRLGVSPQDCVGKKCFEIFHHKKVPPEECPHQRFLKHGRLERSEGFSRRLNGHFITTISPFDAGDPATRWCIHLAHEITDRKRAEKELMRLRNLESIGTLAGGMAHDFNNILTALVGNIELAKFGTKSDKQTGFLDGALKAAFKAKELANRLLTFSKGGSGNPTIQPVMVKRLLEEAIQLSLSGTNISHDLQLPNRLAAIVVDEMQIKTALQNIITNAREAMPWGGMITVRVDEVRIDQSKSMAPGNYVKIQISDKGSGIRSDHLDKIFDPYFTTKKMGAEKGMGLGLAISHSVVKKHCGHIAVEARDGLGTTVSVYLPCSPKKPTKQLSQAASRPPLATKGKARPRILVMDDEMMLWDVIQQMLERMDCDADFVPNGEEAIERYQRQIHSGDPYTALLLDLTIRGGMGAKEIIEKILAIDPLAKAAVFSGYSSDPVLRDFRRYGFVQALQKPFRVDEFNRFISQVVQAPEASDVTIG
ncbi:MAG: ATP-binding protein [Desulfosarcina sp.]